MSYYAIDYTNELAHHGILGMKWGVRRFQNEDGSLTTAGKIRYYGAGGDRKGYYKQIGQAKRYKDAYVHANRKAVALNNHLVNTYGLGKSGAEYREWRDKDKANRRFGYADFAKEKREQDLIKAFGSKKALNEARALYEKKHPNAKRNDMIKGTLIRGKSVKTMLTPAIAGAIVGKQKDPTKYLRKNARYTVKNAAKSIIRTATGRPISGAYSGLKALESATFGTPIAVARTAGRVNKNLARGAAGVATSTALATPKRLAKGYKQLADGSRLYNEAKYDLDYASKGQARDRNVYNKVDNTVRNAYNKASTKVKTVAKDYYGTAKEVADYVKPSKKKKRS